MDAHVFRRFCAVLTELLPEARLEKIQSPAADVHIFTFYAQQRKQLLVLRHDRRNPLLFLSPARYSTGQHPPASTMRLRKYAAGRRVKAMHVDWPARCLHLCFQLATPAMAAPPPLTAAESDSCAKPDSGAPSNPQPETWLSLDLRHGPVLTLGRSPDVGQEALWPSPEQAAACLLPSGAPVTPPTGAQGTVAGPETIGPEKDAAVPLAQPWEQWPVLTPALRRSLQHLDTLDQAALLADLEYGGGDIFVYSSPQQADDAGGGAQKGERPAKTSTALECVAWPLPPAVRGARCEQVYEDPVQALSLVGTHMVLGGLARAEQQNAASPHKREAKRLSRVLDKLEREEQRLRAMVAGKDRALYLQSVLWYFAPEARPADLVQALMPVPPPACAKTAPSAQGGPEAQTGVNLPPLPPCPFDPALLQPQLSLRENMEALFHGAARGQRGLAMLHERRALVRGQVHSAESAAEIASHAPPPVPSAPCVRGQAAKGQGPSVQQGKGGASTDKAGKQIAAPITVGQRLLPKNVEAFTSVDGLIILRGKDAKGNLALLKLGAPSDLWLHVEGGPGAHTLIRRASVGQEIPQSTLEQAATLAAIKSWQKGNERVGVQCAEVRHIKPMRGVATGTVRIDKVACMVWVNMPLLVPSLEG